MAKPAPVERWDKLAVLLARTIPSSGAEVKAIPGRVVRYSLHLQHTKSITGVYTQASLNRLSLERRVPATETELLRVVRPEKNPERLPAPTGHLIRETLYVILAEMMLDCGRVVSLVDSGSPYIKMSEYSTARESLEQMLPVSVRWVKDGEGLYPGVAARLMQRSLEASAVLRQS
ncbi:hypothetical protein HQQ82_02630 [Rathayibacter sp. VKM Ac-2856]|uniref:hypothetical protein n=1 Tax=unclassified Rathayibacter TaxID=2609250 RepID=UPI0015669DFD|nr:MULTISPECIES: hypothetical protein [unclassified Rathayibacter]NQX03689.1 hypothetical protein [Rathayibacter sp. VKM Ac-2858]NQX18857.1 hypothetical protein [Rathayibacter sp. VKM Ac-2856]